jgi:hypothetical protein
MPRRDGIHVVPEDELGRVFAGWHGRESWGREHVVDHYRSGKVLLVLYVRHASEPDWREQDIVPAAEGGDKIMAHDFAKCSKVSLLIFIGS